MKRTVLMLVVLVLGVLTIGCGPENANGPLGDVTTVWKIQFDLDSPSAADREENEADRNVGFGLDGIDSVTIIYGAVVVRSLRFGVSGGTVDTDITAEDESRDMDDADITLQGPYVLLINSAAFNLGSDVVAPGSYNELRFVMQPARITDNLQGVDDLIGNSILVKGRVWSAGQNQRFTFTSDYTSEYVVGGAFDLVSGSDPRFTLSFNAGRWFRFGNRWLDPRDGDNRATILSNIRRHITAGPTDD